MRTAQGTETTAMNAGRQAELRRLLEERRREVSDDLRERVRDVRSKAWSSDAMEVVDVAEMAEADVQGELHFSLLQMKAETLDRIDQALTRLDAGEFGRCLDCGDEIAERRLRALPFAFRCTPCEQARELRLDRARAVAQRAVAGSRFSQH